MFNNLIESSSHTKEYKRRGSFLLFTGATYVVLFVIAGVVSIYAYDAHLERQSTDLELLTWVPQPPVEAVPEAVRDTVRPASNTATAPDRPTRTDLVDSTSNPNNAPHDIGTVASSVPPAPRNAVLGPVNADPIAPPGGGRGTGGTGNTSVVIDMPDAPPPPPPTPKPAPKVLKVSIVLNSEALYLPVPAYPILARQTRTQGTVIVQVLISEDGNVVSAKATSGHPFLVPEAEKAAMRARFSPTMLNDQKVKVSGVITYNFKLDN
ncbi:MAG TPA: energy transducer TonB [Pyrinomonadaceae bacterium]|nr:energy transducer TonB [Pyrinomonadaceae bacterium]